jgi:hypothetical protein
MPIVRILSISSMASSESHSTLSADNLIRQLQEPARLLRDPAAESAIVDSVGHSESEKLQREARSRIETVEIFRQQNLRSIVGRTPAASGKTLQIRNRDWLIEFVETAKDTSDPTIQEIWAKILTGEANAPGSCSKRTLHMVKQLAPAEAQSINRICPRVVFLDDADDGRTYFINGIIKRVETGIPTEDAKETVLLDAKFDGGTRAIQKLVDSGFLSDGDLQFSFSAEGFLSADKLELSKFSPRGIFMGRRGLLADRKQGGLLYAMRERANTHSPQILSSVASIAFDAWKLTVAGAELYDLVHHTPDFDVLSELKAALERGGLSVSETSI